MEEIISNIDWKFWIGDVFVPVGLFFLGYILGDNHGKKKAIANTKGNKNTIIQNSEIHK